MVNKCVVFGCKSGHDNQQEKVSGFSFPLNNPDLLEKWVKFVNRPEWKPSKSSVICVKHFQQEFVNNWHEKEVAMGNAASPHFVYCRSNEKTINSVKHLFTTKSTQSSNLSGR